MRASPKARIATSRSNTFNLDLIITQTIFSVKLFDYKLMTHSYIIRSSVTNWELSTKVTISIPYQIKWHCTYIVIVQFSFLIKRIDFSNYTNCCNQVILLLCCSIFNARSKPTWHTYNWLDTTSSHTNFSCYYKIT